MNDNAKVAENYIPPGDKWEFDELVTRDFDKMLEASIPSYRSMRHWVEVMGKQFLPSTGYVHIMDLGASRGEAIEPFVTHPFSQLTLVETSAPMLKHLRARFGNISNIRISDINLRYDYKLLKEFYPDATHGLYLCVLTMMFIPVEYRQAFLRSLKEAMQCHQHSRLILVEKTLGETAETDEWLTDAYYNMKRENGYNEEAILRKKIALEGVLVPKSIKENEAMLRNAGFTKVHTFWQALNFVGWVVEI